LKAPGLDPTTLLPGRRIAKRAEQHVSQRQAVVVGVHAVLMVDPMHLRALQHVTESAVTGDGTAVPGGTPDRRAAHEFPLAIRPPSSGRRDARHQAVRSEQL
jgi:hypothetical protein